MQLTKPRMSFFAEDFELMKAKISPAEIIEILSGISDLCIFGETDYRPLSAKQQYCWDKLKNDFDKDLINYRTAVNNGRKGGRPAKKTQEETQNITQEETQNITQEESSLTLDTCHLTHDSCHLVGSSAGEPAPTPTEGEKEKNKKFIPPTVEEVLAYCLERENGVNAERFVDFYQSKGWLVGKSKMKDWRAAVRNWEREGVSAAGGRKAQNWTGMTNEELEARF